MTWAAILALSLGGRAESSARSTRSTAAVEAQLDVLEEVEPDGSGEYLRREVSVVVDGTPRLCLVYEIHPRASRADP